MKDININYEGLSFEEKNIIKNKLLIKFTSKRSSKECINQFEVGT